MDEQKLKVEVWGDSLMLGVVLDDVYGRYRILKENAVTLTSQALKVTMENFSKFGSTVLKGKQRMFTALSKGKCCDMAVLEYGGNDCDMNWEEIAAHPEGEHDPKVPLKVFSSQIQEMIDALLAHGIVPLLTSLPPLHPGRYLNWICRKGLSKENILKYLGDISYIYRHQERYSLEMMYLALKNNCRLIDIRSAFLEKKNIADLLCFDGIHPNEKGQRVIREAFVSSGIC